MIWSVEAVLRVAWVPVAILVIGFVAMPLLGSRWVRVHAREQFPVPVPAEEVLRRVQALAVRRRGWRLEPSEQPGTVRIRTRATWATWMKRIEVTAMPDGWWGCHVWVSAGAPQLVDWGDGRRAVAAVRAAAWGY